MGGRTVSGGAARSLTDPYVVLVRLALAWALGGGFSLGLLALALRQGWLHWPLPWPVLAQLHGQVQTLGFLLLFVVGVAARLFPPLLATTLPQPGRVTAGGVLLALGLLLRLVAQPILTLPGRPVWLAASALLPLVALGLLVTGFWPLVRRAVVWESWLVFPALGLLTLAASLGLHGWAGVVLAGGTAVVPAPLDRATVDLALWGFPVLVAFGVSARILPRFLHLRPASQPLALAGGGLYTLGLLSLALSALGPPAVGAGGRLAMVAGLLAFLAGLRLYEPPVRSAGAPQITEPSRRWLRWTYLWLPGGSLLLAAEALTGPATLPHAGAAARHAVGQGFLLLLIVVIGARILPGFAPFMTSRPRLLTALATLGSAGALLRVLGELLRLRPLADLALALGAGLSTLGFAVFAVLLWPRLTPVRRAAPADRPRP
jgi:hypothetical protein